MLFLMVGERARWTQCDPSTKQINAARAVMWVTRPAGRPFTLSVRP